MFLYLSKFLPLLVYPLGLTCVLILLALLIRSAKWQKGVLILAFLALFLGGNGWVARALAKPLEWRYLPPAATPHAEVIVILAGDERSAHFPRSTPEFGEAGDREIYAAHLYHQGAAPYILFSGGTIDWLSSEDAPWQTAEYLLKLAGVPSSALWFEKDSRNTYESAVACKKILEEKGIHRIILVTSAVHMPRSVSLFLHQGLEVIPAPTDYYVTQGDLPSLRQGGIPSLLISLLPSSDNLEITSRTLKEYIGIFIYKLLGWL